MVPRCIRGQIPYNMTLSRGLRPDSHPPREGEQGHSQSRGEGHQRGAYMSRWCHSAVHWEVSGSESLRSISSLGPLTTKLDLINTQQMLREVFQSMQNKKALNSKTKQNCLFMLFFKMTGCVKLQVWHQQAFELTGLKLWWRNKQPRGQYTKESETIVCHLYNNWEGGTKNMEKQLGRPIENRSLYSPPLTLAEFCTCIPWKG